MCDSKHFNHLLRKEFTFYRAHEILISTRNKNMKNTHLLNQILTKLTPNPDMTAETICNVCVFDLDSTLFNVSPRTVQILKEFAVVNQTPDLLNIEVNPKDWGLKEILLRAGYDMSEQHHENLKTHKNLIAFWTEKFFSNTYLHYDTPYLGAVNFVQTLFENNIEIHYLTGRDVQRMGLGTHEVLLKWGFPIQSEHHVHLKPHRDLDDHQFKLDWVINFKKQKKEQPIYFFENEPVNINAIGSALPDIKIVYLNTTHSRKENVQVPVIEIDHFALDGTESDL